MNDQRGVNRAAEWNRRHKRWMMLPTVGSAQGPCCCCVCIAGEKREVKQMETQLFFTFLSLCKHLSTGYLPGTAGSLDLETLALAGAAACQELRHFAAEQPQPSSEGSISPPSPAGTRCQTVSSLICLESSLVPALFASSHGNRQAAEKVFHPHALPDNSLEPASVCLEAQLLAASWDLFLRNCC